MLAENFRQEGGLTPKGYLKQIGERPGGAPVDVARFGQKRVAPSLEGERPTPAEAKLISQIEKLRTDMQPPALELAAQNAERAKNVPSPSGLTPQQYARRIRPLLAEAQRLDAERHIAGKSVMFEKALPRAPGEQRTLEQQYNEHVATLAFARGAASLTNSSTIEPVACCSRGMEQIRRSVAYLFAGLGGHQARSGGDQFGAGTAHSVVSTGN